MHGSLPRLLITPGEPAGIGPDITIQLAQQQWPAECIVVADPNLLHERAKLLSLPLTLIPWDPTQKAEKHQAGTLRILPVALPSACVAGQLNPQHASYVLDCLRAALPYCLNHTAHALVTGPVHKGVINTAGIAFRGHTEFLAENCGVSQTVMLFVTPQTKVALATTHLPLADVPRALTAKKLETTLRILHQALQSQFACSDPRIVVCGLNPHAGEQGHLGREEIDTIEPVLNKLRKEQFTIQGPLPADTIFTEKTLQSADAILAMYHDQALPVVKYMSFGQAVNMTLGLPFIRTSVDHGTALDIAGTGKADVGSLTAAIHLALLIKQKTI